MDPKIGDVVHYIDAALKREAAMIIKINNSWPKQYDVHIWHDDGTESTETGLLWDGSYPYSAPCLTNKA